MAWFRRTALAVGLIVGLPLSVVARTAAEIKAEMDRLQEAAQEAFVARETKKGQALIARMQSLIPSFVEASKREAMAKAGLAVDAAKARATPAKASSGGSPTGASLTPSTPAARSGPSGDLAASSEPPATPECTTLLTDLKIRDPATAAMVQAVKSRADLDLDVYLEAARRSFEENQRRMGGSLRLEDSPDALRVAEDLGREMASLGLGAWAGDLTWDEAVGYLGKGQVERGFNAMEQVAAKQLGMSRAGVQMSLAQAYLQMADNTDRALVLVSEVRHAADAWICGRRSRGPSGPLGAVARANALQTWRAMLRGSDALLAQILARRGELSSLRRLAEEAEARAVAARKREDPTQVMTWAFAFGRELTLSTVWRYLGDALADRRPSEAEEAWRKALAVLDAVGAAMEEAGVSGAVLRTAPEAHRARWSAYLYARLGDLAAATRAFERHDAQVKLYHQQNPTAPPIGLYARAWLEFADLKIQAGDLAGAQALASRARGWFDDESHYAGNPEYRSLGWKPDAALARIHALAGRPKEAIEAGQRAIEELERQYRSIRSGSLKSEFLKVEEVRTTYRRLISDLLSAGRKDEALAYLERSKSAALLDMLKGVPLQDRSRWPQTLLDEEQRIESRMRKLQRTRDGGGPAGTRSIATPEDAARLEGEIEQVRWEYELFLRQVAEVVQGAATTESSKATDRVWYRSPDELKAAAARRPGRVLVEYFDAGDQLFAFVLRGGEMHVVDCGSTDTLRKEARRLRRYVAAKSRRWEKPAATLYQALVEPWAAQLAGAAEVVLVPTDFLYGLPFAAFLDGQGRSFAEGRALSVTSQASLLAEPGEAPDLPPGRLVYGDPDGSLPNARVEAEQVAALCAGREGCRVLYGDAATESDLKQTLGHGAPGPRPGVLHLATHGLLESGWGLFSSLVMAPDETDDGSLRVAEVFSDLDLRETPVVVLSACNTALGEAGGGDEVVGLARGFQYAGARWVIASLWEVDDAASAAWMTAFHRALGEGQAPDVAVTMAGASVRQAKADWAHPYYWAAFAAMRR